MTRESRFRLCLMLTGTLCLGAAWVRDRPMPAGVAAAVESDPNIIWSIGKRDGSADEFGLGRAHDLTYVVGKSIPSKNWRRWLAAGLEGAAPVHKIRFRLESLPATTPLLEMDLYTIGIAPRTTEVTVNGARGHFPLRPLPAFSADDTAENSATYNRYELRIPIDKRFLHTGDNEIALSYLVAAEKMTNGAGKFEAMSGNVFYDYLALRRSGGEGADLTASVAPTIFYKRHANELREVAEILVDHRQPLGESTAVLKVKERSVTAKLSATADQFGRQVYEIEAPAVSAPAPYQLDIKADGKTERFQGEFQPEKRWRIFAGLRIHNDIGFTQYQSNVQELDNRNTDQLLELLRRFPFYKFVLEDTWLVENYLSSRDVQKRSELMSYAARDRVGINPLYLNLLTGLCTGEELHRALYPGKAIGKKYGVAMRSASVTDAPSHTWFLPSLLSDAGVKAFALGSNQTRAPLLIGSRLNEDSPFYWEGADGKRVMAWYARAYGQMLRLVGDRPGIERLHISLPQFLARYRRPDYVPDAVMLYGLCGDNAQIKQGEAATVAEWNRHYEFPKIIAATDADYFDYVSAHFGGKLPVYKGDGGAYWEDGAGSSALETALNRDSQRMLPAAEMLSALATVFEPSQIYPAGEFHEAWKNLLFYDEHTWGSSDSVRQPDRDWVTGQWELKRAYAWRASWAAKDLLLRAMSRLVQNISIGGPTLFVFNTDLWPRTDFVQLDVEPNRVLTDLATGKPVVKQVIREKPGYQVVRFLAERVPGLGYKAYGLSTGEPPPAEAQARKSWQIESRYYRVRFDPATGAIAELRDLELGRDLVDPSAPYKLNQLLYVKGGEQSSVLRNDLSPLGDLAIHGSSKATLVENTGKRIRIRSSAPSLPGIETEVMVDDAVKRVDIVNRLVKEEVHEKEAVYFAFPFRVSPPEVAYQVQNAWVRPNTDQLPGAAREWFTTQNLALARDAGVTIAWATPDAPLFTFCDINRGLWPKNLKVKNGYIFSYPMNNYWFTNYKAGQGGRFTFRYFISSGARLSYEQLARMDAETRSPLMPYEYFNFANTRLQPVERRMPLAAGSFFDIDSDHAQVTAFKAAEDGNGFILRLRETAGREGVAGLKSPLFPLASASLCNGVEDITAPLGLKGGGATDIPLKPWQFSTVRLVFAHRMAIQKASR